MLHKAKQTTLIKYPCAFPIKIMGKAHKNFIQIAVSIVKQHAPDFDVKTIEIKKSVNSNYYSVTCTINAISRTQLDAIYRELYNHPMVSLTL